MKYKEIDEFYNFGNEYFNVERIITRKYKDDKKYYLVKWVGYPLKDCSWEPASNLENIKLMVENFDNNYPNSINKRLLKKYFRLIHGNKRNKSRNKDNLKLKKYLKYKDNFNNNNLLIRINNSIIFSKEENMKEKKEEKYKDIEVLIKISDEKEDEKYKQEKFAESNEKYEDKIVNKEDINLIKIENIPIDDKDDAPKLIRPIIIW